MAKKYDIVVLGLGAMGSAAIYQLSQSGKKILGIDQFTPPHTNGSSHGDTRITREAIGEGRAYTPLARLSNEIWEEIEEKTKKDLLTRCGGLVFGPENVETKQHGVQNFLRETIAAAKDFGIEHKLLNHKDLTLQYPQFRYHGDEIGYYENRAGFLRPERCIDTQLQLAKHNGATLFYNLKVIKIEPKGNNDGVLITTAQENYECETLIISAGAWLNNFLPTELKKHFKIFRQLLFWFEPEINIETFSIENFSVYIRVDNDSENMFYGFPAIDGKSGGIKFGIEQFHTPCTADTLDKTVTNNEIDSVYNQVSQYLRIKENCIRSAACMYTVSPNDDFVIDHLPNHPQIIVASPCSGHGFKHSAGIGRILKELSLGEKPTVDISHFSFERLLNTHSSLNR